VKSTGLKPFLDPLEPAEREMFIADYLWRIRDAYPPRKDGKVLLRFPRLFIVAIR
jgi:trans-aconitate 2-methyltransferase